MIFTFWEGKMPAYIKNCLDTWKVDYTLITFDTLKRYTNLDIESLKGYTLAQISDVVRAHVLRDNGGYWLDADTIMLSDNLPKENMIGVPKYRTAHCGFLNFEQNAPMIIEWANKQDEILSAGIVNSNWDLFANSLSDKCLEMHNDVTIADRTNYVAESYMIKEQLSNYDKYKKFYFSDSYRLKDLNETSLLMLHNSWTPDWYKQLTMTRILNHNCTLSNILREVLK